MSVYSPNNWVILKINDDNNTHYRVLAGWYGGYLSADSWRLNSGICDVKKEDDTFLFYGLSGSCYRCYKYNYGLRGNNVYVWNRLEKKYGDKIELLDEKTDWLSIDWT